MNILKTASFSYLTKITVNFLNWFFTKILLCGFRVFDQKNDTGLSPSNDV